MSSPGWAVTPRHGPPRSRWAASRGSSTASGREGGQPLLGAVVHFCLGHQPRALLGPDGAAVSPGGGGLVLQLEPRQLVTHWVPAWDPGPASCGGLAGKHPAPGCGVLVERGQEVSGNRRPIVEATRPPTPGLRNPRPWACGVGAGGQWPRVGGCPLSSGTCPQAAAGLGASGGRPGSPTVPTVLGRIRAGQ